MRVPCHFPPFPNRRSPKTTALGKVRPPSQRARTAGHGSPKGVTTTNCHRKDPADSRVRPEGQSPGEPELPYPRREREPERIPSVNKRVIPGFYGTSPYASRGSIPPPGQGPRDVVPSRASRGTDPLPPTEPRISPAERREGSLTDWNRGTPNPPAPPEGNTGKPEAGSFPPKRHTATFPHRVASRRTDLPGAS